MGGRRRGRSPEWGMVQAIRDATQARIATHRAEEAAGVDMTGFIRSATQITPPRRQLDMSEFIRSLEIN